MTFSPFSDARVQRSILDVRVWGPLLLSCLLVLLPGCDSGKSNLAPSASFTFEPSNPRAGTAVKFTGRPSDPEGKIDELIWHFRRKALGYEERTKGKTPTHAFPQKGEYEVEFTVRDDIGSTDKATKTVPVRLRYGQVAIRDTVRVRDVSFTTANDGEDAGDDGQEWPKEDSDPALYYRLSDSTGTTLHESEVYTTSTFVPGEDLPIVFENVDVSTSELSSSYALSLYEADSSSVDDLIRTIDFSFKENVACNVNAAPCYPDVKVLKAPADSVDTIVDLFLDWKK